MSSLKLCLFLCVCLSLQIHESRSFNLSTGGLSTKNRPRSITKIAATRRSVTKLAATTRSDFLRSAVVLPLLPLLPSQTLAAFPKNPVVLVLGASGRSGMSTIEACLKRSIPCTSATRTGTDPFKVVKLDKSNYTPYPEPVDVKDVEGE